MPGYKNKLKGGGAVREGLSCSYCNLLLKDAIQTTETGQRFCKECFKEAVRDPNSGVDTRDKTWPDHAVNREISVLVVLCENEAMGCSWEGLVKEFQDHLMQCQFVTVECRNEGCQIRVLIVDLEHHLREQCPQRLVKCVDCEERVRFGDLELHARVCRNAKAVCPNCQKQILASQMSDHIAYDCTWIKCPCDDRLVELGSTSFRNHLQDPAKLADHLQPLLEQFSRLAQELDKMKIELEATKTRVSILEEEKEQLVRRNLSLEQGMNQLSVNMGEKESTLSMKTGEVIQLNEERLAASEHNYNSLFDEVKRNTNTIAQCTRRIEALDNQVNQIQTQVMLGRSTPGGDDFLKESSGDLGRITEYIERVEGKTLEVERTLNVLSVHHSELELQLQASMASTHNGAFLWRIPEVQRRIRDAKMGRVTSIYSPPFYTGRNGYKMCIRAYLNGDGKGEGSHLSIFFVLMKGEYDPLLHWPFEHKVSLVLVDQNHKKHLVQTFKPNVQSNSFQRPKADMNVASGCPEFADVSIYDDQSYVKDDVMFIKAIIDTSKILHP